MITDENHVALALAYLRDGNIAEEVTLQLNMKEFLLERAYSRALLAATGNVEERKAKAKLSDEYRDAFVELAQAKATKAKYEHEKEGSKKTCEIWQSEGANIRAMERIR